MVPFWPFPFSLLSLLNDSMLSFWTSKFLVFDFFDFSIFSSFSVGGAEKGELFCLHSCWCQNNIGLYLIYMKFPGLIMLLSKKRWFLIECWMVLCRCLLRMLWNSWGKESFAKRWHCDNTCFCYCIFWQFGLFHLDFDLCNPFL